MATSFAEFDGPRLMRRDEAVASERLSRLCFNRPEPVSEADVLANYVPPKRGGMYVIARQGKPVSQIYISHDRINVYDGHIRAGNIGGVCTHPEYRGRELASRLLDYCARQLVREGARLMLISGARGVYTRLGNVPHGRFLYFSIKAGQSSRWRAMPADLAVRRATIADTMSCCRLYQAEPVRFVRRNSKFSAALRNPAGNAHIHADQWVIERSGHVLAYLFIGIPWGVEPGSRIRHVAEYAGSRLALADALSALMAAGAYEELRWPAAWQDADLIQMLRDSGFDGAAAPLHSHTLRIINFKGLMDDMRPVMQARLDAGLLRGLHFEQSGPLLGGLGADLHAITRGHDRLELDGAAMTRLVMGKSDVEAEPVNLPGALAEVIPALFPLPSFLPGLNYR